jgi:hypothetical protein
LAPNIPGRWMLRPQAKLHPPGGIPAPPATHPVLTTGDSQE